MKNFLKDLCWFMFERGGLFAFAAFAFLIFQFCYPYESYDHLASMIGFAWSIILAYVVPMKHDIEEIKEKIDRNK